MRALISAVLVMALSGCSKKELLFESRAPHAPLVEKLRASGGDPQRVLRPSSVEQLRRLEPGAKYKFVVDQRGALVVAPQPVDPPNEYVHPILGGGLPVRTAGNLHVAREGPQQITVTLDRGSKAYCPSASSLGAAVEALRKLGLPAEAIRVEDRPPECLAPGTTGGPGMMGPR